MNEADLKRARELAEDLVRQLQAAGYTAYWAGGCVRDLLMGQTPKDYDVATSARPEEVLRLFPDADLVGKSFGVVRVRREAFTFEVATFRHDHAYRDGRRPEGVSFTDPVTDAARRDFTVNAIFYDPLARQFFDFTGGRRDLDARLIRCVGDPRRRFAEDYLRMLRAVRFAATLDFTLEPETAEAIRREAHRVTEISPERIRDELVRLLTEARRPGDALLQLEAAGLLRALLPEVAAMQNQAQPPEFHPEGDVFTHTVRMLNLMRSPTRRLALAALLHDVGKPVTAARDPTGRIRFDCHAERGADIAVRILTRLRCANEDVAVVAHCVRNHMRFQDAQRMKRSTLRRFVGAPEFPLELELHRLDCLASHGSLDTYRFLQAVLEELQHEPVLPRPWVTGHDLIRLGLPEGPQVGLWHKRAYDAQLEQRFADRDALLRWLEGKIREAPPPEPRRPPGA